MIEGGGGWEKGGEEGMCKLQYHIVLFSPRSFRYGCNSYKKYGERKQNLLSCALCLFQA